MQSRDVTLRYRHALVLSACCVLFAYKAVAIAANAPVPVMLGWAVEAWTLFALSCALDGVERLGVRAVALAARALFYFCFYTLLLTVLAHTFFFESAAERRFSLLEIDLRMLGFFFRNVLPPRGYLLIGGLLAAIHAGALALVRVLPTQWPRRALVGTGVLALPLGAAVALRPRVPSPLADMVASLRERAATEPVLVDRGRPARFDARALDKSAAPRALPGFDDYDRVLVFVMETMTSETFERERRALAPTTFVNAAEAHAHQFTRYFATNQDSRTGMLSMLGSRFIPYEAYTEEGRDGYLFLSQKSSLVDLFAAKGYRTAFAVSQVEMELVVADLPWDDRLHFDQSDIARLRERHLCFVPYEFEHSCEDRALLPRVLSYIDRHPRLFLYQEFIWGHAAEYNEASGRTNTDYYSAYLDAVVAHLQKSGALERTLIVLTSDHGFRDKGLQTERSVYQIPLWFYAPEFEARRDARLHSHLDFKDLLLHELAPALPEPDEAPFVMAVGPTGTSFVAVVTAANQLLLLRARESGHQLLFRDGKFGPNDPTPADFLRLFEDSLAHFAQQRR